MATEHPIGQVVLVHDPRLAKSLGREGEAAIVLQRRRGGARIGFLSDGGNAWVEDPRLYALKAPPPSAPLVDAVSTALGCLHVEEVEFAAIDAAGVELHARCLDFEEEQLSRLRELLGDRLVSWSIAPYGMAAIMVILELRLGA